MFEVSSLSNVQDIRRINILTKIKSEFKEKYNLSSVEILILCMNIFLNPNATIEMIVGDLLNFKSARNNRYNLFIDSMLEKGYIDPEYYFITNYSKEFEVNYQELLYKYTNSDYLDNSLIEKFKIGERDEVLSKVYTNLRNLDEKIVTPLEKYFNTHFVYDLTLQVDIKDTKGEEDNYLIKYGYATRLKFNLVQGFEIYKLIKESYINIDYGICYLTNDDYVFITVPNIIENYNSGALLNKIIL